MKTFRDVIFTSVVKILVDNLFYLFVSEKLFKEENLAEGTRLEKESCRLFYFSDSYGPTQPRNKLQHLNSVTVNDEKCFDL